jgi:hypothetical protein
MDQQQKKIALYAGAAVIVLLAIWLILDKIGSFGGTISEALTGTGETTVNEDNPLEVEQTNLSFAADRYRQYADNIHEAMNYSGTRWTTVYSIIEAMNTADDFAALVNAYGTRNLRIFGVPSGPLNLGQSFIRESWIGQDGYAEVNEIICKQGYKFSILK